METSKGFGESQETLAESCSSVTGARKKKQNFGKVKYQAVSKTKAISTTNHNG